jgi:hypothetical protein
MANFTYAGTVDGSEPMEREFDVAAGTDGSILDGSAAVVSNGYAVLVPNAGAAAGNGFYGMALGTSTETATAAGTVRLKFSPAGLVVKGVATTPSNLSAATLFDKCTMDLSGTTQTIDENDAGALTIWRYPESTYATTGIIEVVLPWTFAS